MAEGHDKNVGGPNWRSAPTQSQPPMPVQLWTALGKDQEKQFGVAEPDSFKESWKSNVENMVKNKIMFKKNNNI